MMADSYMPLYLFILYRYANSLLGTGETHRAAELFEKLCEGTERLIGITNTYGIHCLERLATAAEADGQHLKALAAIQSMKKIAEEEFGADSAVAIAVRRFCGRMEEQNPQEAEEVRKV
jgi:DNA-binding SARP family transcriptional activator